MSERYSNRTPFLILRHPQEKKEEKGTAELLHSLLENSFLVTGLSWPNLKKIIGEESNIRNWGVLYLGGKSESGKVRPLAEGESITPLEGVILLDGTWKQAKTLWWRNAWLLKARRLVLNPKSPSLYQHYRREPRRECLATIESAAYVLRALGEDPKISEGLTNAFREFLKDLQEK